MQINEFFSRELIKIDLDVDSDKEAIRELAGLLYEKGYVKNTFPDAVIEREKVFATGLPCDVCGIAIPHTDPTHVNKMAIAIGVLKKPIKFGLMGGNKKIDVDIVFLMALQDCQSQVQMLQKFAEFFQQEDELAKIRKAVTENDILRILEKSF